MTRQREPGGIGEDESRSRQTSRLLAEACMLKRHLGILQNTLSQSLSTLKWLVFKPSWTESLFLLSRTSPCPCVPGLMWDEEGTVLLSGLEEPGLLANTGSCPWVCVMAQRLCPPSKLHLCYSNSTMCTIARLALKNPIWNTFSCFREN